MLEKCGENLWLSTLRPVDRCDYRPCARTRKCYPRRGAMSNTAYARRLPFIDHHDPSHMVCSCKTKHGASLHPSPSNHTDVPKSNLRSLGKLERTQKWTVLGSRIGPQKCPRFLGPKTARNQGDRQRSRSWTLSAGLSKVGQFWSHGFGAASRPMLYWRRSPVGAGAAVPICFYTFRHFQLPVLHLGQHPQSLLPLLALLASSDGCAEADHIRLQLSVLHP